jgi:hypothetical protein
MEQPLASDKAKSPEQNFQSVVLIRLTIGDELLFSRIPRLLYWKCFYGQ